jgi:hypothetical protein
MEVPSRTPPTDPDRRLEMEPLPVNLMDLNPYRWRHPAGSDAALRIENAGLKGEIVTLQAFIEDLQFELAAARQLVDDLERDRVEKFPLTAAAACPPAALNVIARQEAALRLRDDALALAEQRCATAERRGMPVGRVSR